MSDQHKQDQGSQQEDWKKKQQETGRHGEQDMENKYPQSDRDRMDRERMEKEQQRKRA